MGHITVEIAILGRKAVVEVVVGYQVVDSRFDLGQGTRAGTSHDAIRCDAWADGDEFKSFLDVGWPWPWPSFSSDLVAMSWLFRSPHSLFLDPFQLKWAE